MIRYYTLQFATLITTVRSMSISANTIKSPVITERIYTCSDGVKLAARHWVNFDVDDTLSSSQQCTTRKILCLHGWLDNAASFNRLVPLLLDSAEDIPTQIVALDFPGHGLSGHKSSDGPPQLLAGKSALVLFLSCEFMCSI